MKYDMPSKEWYKLIIILYEFFVIFLRIMKKSVPFDTSSDTSSLEDVRVFVHK
jgi:hypothetical protein